MSEVCVETMPVTTEPITPAVVPAATPTPTPDVLPPPLAPTENGNHQSSLHVTTGELLNLLEHFAKTTYKARDTQPKVQSIMQKCLSLFGADYKYSVIPNTNGELSTNYPSILVVLEEEKNSNQIDSTWTGTKKLESSLLYSTNGSATLISNGFNGSAITLKDKENWSIDKSCLRIESTTVSDKSALNNEHDTNHLPEDGKELIKMKDLCSKARFARCRARFPIPVILYNKKNVCRSATLSGGPEIYGRSSFDYFFSGGADYSKLDCVSDEEMCMGEAQSEWQLFDRVRSQDIRLLKAFKVQTIIDLMVEKKKVKFGLNVTSSEKVDKENRYVDFNIVSLPYPGCEFFKQYRDNGYNGEELVFEWNQGHVDADICVPSDPTAASLNLNWSQYRDWDLIVLTQNYLKLLLAYLHEGQKGILVHCISGWDRTPLFISLLRLSLWADGRIHKSLDADQMLYLTLAYDWLLFGHNLEDRLSKGEEIMFFCFNFLKYIIDPEFCVDEIRDLPTQFKISKVRSDTDIHLNGILLDGSVTSPEGSNWSLNSCGSSQSSKSLSENNPPTYFQVSQQNSFDDCGALVPAFQNAKNGLSSAHPITIAQTPVLRTCAITTSCLITNSMINSITCNGSLESCNGLSAQSANSQLIATSVSQNSPITFAHESQDSKNLLSPVGKSPVRTSPVPVPKPRLIPRLETDSSASIGSWQLITGAGSLREIISSSDPGSNSSIHSHHSKPPMSELDGIEPSESICTLVDNLTPVQGNHSLCLFPSMKQPKLPKENGTDVSLVDNHDNLLDEDELKYEYELGLALDENLECNGIEFEDADIDTLFTKPLTLRSLIGEQEPITLTSTPTEDNNDSNNTSTPTIENENNNHIILTKSKRQERLEDVGSKFHALYSQIIGFRASRPAAESNGGLGSLIGTFASKVGIRSATTSNRVNHV